MYRRFFAFILMMMMGSIIQSYAQPSKIKFRNRLGDSTTLVNIATKPVKPPKIKPLNGDINAALSINTNGWGVIIDYRRYFGSNIFGNQTDRFHHEHTFQLEIGEIKHPKEVRYGGSTILGISFMPHSYVLGKMNNLYHAKIGYGQNRLIAGKPESGTVAIHWTNVVGVSLGLVKPYYLDIANVGNVKYADSIEAYFINPGYISGSAGFSKGINEIKIKPGLYFKSGLIFDFANARRFVSAIELGANAEVYFQKISQMVRQDPKQAFFNAYIAIHLGRRF